LIESGVEHCEAARILRLMPHAVAGIVGRICEITARNPEEAALCRALTVVNEELIVSCDGVPDADLPHWPFPAAEEFSPAAQEAQPAQPAEEKSYVAIIRHTEPDWERGSGAVTIHPDSVIVVSRDDSGLPVPTMHVWDPDRPPPADLPEMRPGGFVGCIVLARYELHGGAGFELGHHSPGSENLAHTILRACVTPELARVWFVDFAREVLAMHRREFMWRLCSIREWVMMKAAQDPRRANRGDAGQPTDFESLGQQ